MRAEDRGDEPVRRRLDADLARDPDDRAAQPRQLEAAAALELLGCDVTLVPTRHPVVDIVPFQLLTLDLAEARGVDPDMIRWDDPRWKRARDAYA